VGSLSCRRLRDSKIPLPTGVFLLRTRQLFVSSDFFFPLSSEQDRFVQPGPPRLGIRHPRMRYQRTTAISNNQTQLISLPFSVGVSGHRLLSGRTRHHPSFCSRPSSPGAFRSKCPVWATATTGQKTIPRPQSKKATDYSFLSSLGLHFFSGRSRRGHPVIREGSGR
jgi:hypothetical protein